MYIKTRHALPYVTRPSAEQLDEAFHTFKDNPSPENRDSLLEMSRRYSLAKHRYADDLALRVMVNVWRATDPTCASPLTPYDPSKGAKFSTWLYQVTARRAIDAFRSEKSREVATDTEELEQRIAFALRADPWHSGGRRWTSKAPTADEQAAPQS